MKCTRGRFRQLRKLYLHKQNQQKRGSLAKRRKPNGIDEAGYIMSMFLSGPSPSFGTAALKLGGQAFKGIKDNV